MNMRNDHTAAPRIIDSVIRTADGRTRSHRIYVPASLPAHPAPLLVALHGGMGSNLQFERSSGFDLLAERFGFIVVYPNGVGRGPDDGRFRTWNAGICCGPAVRMRVDDVGHVRQLIAAVEAQFPIDRTRVFAAGHSNGGLMAYRLACELSDRIVAVGIQSGGLGVSGCAPTHPVSVLHVHGTADPNVPIGGGIGSNSIARVSFPSAEWSTRTIAAAMGCDDRPIVEHDPTNPDLEIRTRRNTATLAEVRLVAVRGAGHGWMGSTVARGRPRGRPLLTTPASTSTFDTSSAIVQFLLSHPRRA